jgi:nucleolar complex protein 3
LRTEPSLTRLDQQTETLKLLFVLYFSILKATSVPGPLLASALEGLARFAHRINVDFFRDLLAVLRTHVGEALAVAETQSRASHGGAELLSDNEDAGDDEQEAGTAAWGADAVKTRSQRRNGMREALLCLVTAFELLSGQGEALNIDLADMAAHLYGIMIPLSLSPTIEDAPELLSGGPNTEAGGKDKGVHLLRTDADLLLRALELILLRPRAATLSSERTAAFAKRALTCALQLPPATAIRLLGIVRACVARDARLEAFLDTQDRAKDGRYDATSDDVDAARPLGAGEAAWELHLLMRSANADVAAEAKRVASWQR